jgi:hypothetical protein
LNKEHPNIPQLINYRPIIIVNPIIKFLEGYIMPQLNYYAIHHLPHAQNGFKPKASIETCKKTVIDAINNFKLRR